MNPLIAVYRRELAAYAATPMGAALLVVFLLAHAACAFYLGRILESDDASLAIAFAFHPWLYLFFMPALAMRLFAEERESGTFELLATLPIPLSHIVLAKFLAAWTMAVLALILTAPLWATISYLGEPDHGTVLAGYLASLLLAGAYLALSLAVSVLAKSQITAFIAALLLCFLFSITGDEAARGALAIIFGDAFSQITAQISFIIHFDAIVKGALHLSDLLFFLSHIAFWLIAATKLADLARQTS